MSKYVFFLGTLFVAPMICRTAQLSNSTANTSSTGLNKYILFLWIAGLNYYIISYAFVYVVWFLTDFYSQHIYVYCSSISCFETSSPIEIAQ